MDEFGTFQIFLSVDKNLNDEGLCIERNKVLPIFLEYNQSNKKEEWKGSNVNPPREHWDKVKNPWFIGPDADKNWNEAKEILKINHEEWLRKNRRKK